MDTIIEEDLPMQVDCIQASTKHQIIALGAYQLVTDPVDQVANEQKRTGRVYILKLTPNVPGGFTVIHELICPSGVLDLKWEPNDEDLLAVATCNSILLFEIKENNFEIRQQILLKEQCIGLYLQWINSDKIIFSDSLGFINILEYEDTFKITEATQCHEALAWIVHYSHDQDIVYSGCDSGILKAFKLSNLTTPSTHTTKRFEIGLTSILTKNELVLIGSYDDELKIFNLTQTDPKIILTLKSKINLGGAVWRTQFLPNLFNTEQDDVHYVAVACARNGFKVVKLFNDNIEICHEFKKYEGFLAYGLHVVTDYKNNSYTFYTCYFDNHVVHVYSLKL